MNIDFRYKNPTTIYFGRKALQNMQKELPHYGDNVLLVYGKGSIKRSGLYDEIMTLLKDNHKTVFECDGVMPNPTYEKVLEGAQIARENDVSLILAVGGGSVLDCAKAIAVTAHCPEDAWQKYWIDFKAIDHVVIPVATVLTMAGTGSEMNGGSVITNEASKLKIGRVFPSDYNPRFSILNPEYTLTLPTYQMVSGIFDSMSHLMEAYFSGDDDVTTDYLIEGLLRSIIHSAKMAVENPKDYEARSNLMWSATLAMNPLMGLSKKQDWQVHMIEHQLGAYTDCAHGMGLAAISLPYYRHIYKEGLDKFVRFAVNVWQINPEGKSKETIAKLGIDALEIFIKSCGISHDIKSLGASEDMLKPIADSTIILGSYKKLDAQEVYDILKEAYNA